MISVEVERKPREKIVFCAEGIAGAGRGGGVGVGVDCGLGSGVENFEVCCVGGGGGIHHFA
eukprot:scaffold11107_cov115-Isochrysis_galbana.AAC.3